MEYKCKKHRSNDGWYDANGRWHCWECTRENTYLYPRGKVLEVATIGSYEIRVITTRSSYPATVEVWKLGGKKVKLKYKHSFKYLSQAMREYNRILEEIKIGIFHEDNAELEESEFSYSPEVNMWSDISDSGSTTSTWTTSSAI